MKLPPEMKLPKDFVSKKRDPTKFEIRLIKNYGKRYELAELPDDIRMGPLGWCFDWSMIECIRLDEKYRYVEGIAKDTASGEGWTLHAWLTDGVHAFDPTWPILKHDTLNEVRYIGIEMPLLTVQLFVKATEYQGVIPNRHMYPHALESVIGVKL